MEALPLPAAKAAQRANLFFADECLEFFAAQQSTSNGFPNRETAFFICAAETLEPIDDGRTALGAHAERLAVRHVFIWMKMLRLSDDLPCEIANVVHERVACKLAMLDFAQAKFPFAGELGAGQLRHSIFQKSDRLDRLRRGLQFLAVSHQVMR